jgi:hypothetical protein
MFKSTARIFYTLILLDFAYLTDTDVYLLLM